MKKRLLTFTFISLSWDQHFYFYHKWIAHILYYYSLFIHYSSTWELKFPDTAKNWRYHTFQTWCFLKMFLSWLMIVVQLYVLIPLIPCDVWPARWRPLRFHVQRLGKKPGNNISILIIKLMGLCLFAYDILIIY